MEKKKQHQQQPQCFFASLKTEVVRGLSPSRSRPKSTMSRRGKRSRQSCLDTPATRSRSLTLAPLMEGPDSGGDPSRSSSVASTLGQWMKGQLSRVALISSSAGSKKSCDLRMMLGVLGAPLAPIPVSSSDPLPILSIKDISIETSSAQYILHQYTAASGGLKLQNSIQSAYALGKLKMVTSESENATRVLKNRSSAQSGVFVLWQMNPDMWYMELAVGDSKVYAGCNRKLVWRHTPWLGAHTAKGPIRPLRRVLQGLDPRTTASLFADARCVGDCRFNDEECFILKLSADSQTLKARSECPAEIIRHNMSGYFSQKSGLLVRIEDSHLTRIQSNGGDSIYWETTINSYLEDYKPVEGIMIAHSGHSVATVFRFGETAMSHTKTRMEESWTIDEVAFNVPGLSADCFIPPADLLTQSIIDEAADLPQDDSKWKNSTTLVTHSAKISALEHSMSGMKM
ncbi:hypothetical protein SAY86_003882 [Trapa natans]|uniref:Uncharacterized protein n=1 Tax=Trapa natans TaxID=22666 RepID=A0AAN7RIC3_TRANT|nr:hypothetical protein SAY86_003882 [Trapa natans]